MRLHDSAGLLSKVHITSLKAQIQTQLERLLRLIARGKKQRQDVFTTVTRPYLPLAQALRCSNAVECYVKCDFTIR